MEFKTLKDNPISILQLVKPEVTKRYFEVSMGNSRYASVDLLHDEGTLVRLETASGSYTIKRMGFFIPYITLRKESEDNDLAISWLDLAGKTTISLNDNTYSFKRYDLWKNQWVWTNEKNRPIVRYKLAIEGTLRGEIEVSNDSFYSEDLELLIALGAYYLLQLNEELARQRDMK